MNKILIVYNTCGISGREPINWYTQCINSLLNQQIDNSKVVISSCKNDLYTRQTLFDTFKNNIAYNFIDDTLTVNITFNHTVQKCVEHFGDFESVLYVDSGVDFQHFSGTLQNAYNMMKFNDFGMLSLRVNNDTGYEYWFDYSKITEKNIPYTIPVGKGMNLHAQLFDKSMYNTYDKRYLPDVFSAFCTESIFSFMCAGTKQKWAIMPHPILNHNKSVDGATSGFSHSGPKGLPWNNLYNSRDILEIVNDPYAYEIGVGYEECNNIMLHNPEAYDSDDNCKQPEKLSQYIKENFFLKKEELDYTTINSTFIK